MSTGGNQHVNSAEEIIPKARESTHKVILDWFSAQTRGKLFDAPAGFGHLAMHLKNMGYQVVCGEIEPEIMRAKGIECVYADLNVAIPSPDESFDYVCCVDGLEHMTDPYRAVAEFTRVLKTWGVGIFAVPNYSNIEKRWKYFLRGYVTKPKTLEDYREAGSSLFNFHNWTMCITILDLIFAINGLRVEAILQDKVKWRQYFFLPLVLILKLEASLLPSKLRNRYRSDLTLKNEIILGGNELIFIVRKDDRGKSSEASRVK
jgi:SAM-dependent methyltransferase